jgi:hypothetical protein
LNADLPSNKFFCVNPSHPTPFCEISTRAVVSLSTTLLPAHSGFAHAGQTYAFVVRNLGGTTMRFAQTEHSSQGHGFLWRQ